MRKLTICGHDVCFYSLVLPKEPSATQKSAAEFLGRVIRSGCGLTLPVAEDAPLAIRIGTRGAAPEIRWDGFRIDARDGQVFLDGNLDRGTLYAAFSFAERFLGYRRFTDDLEVIPENGEASVPEGFHALENPGFEGRRTTCYHHVRSGEFSAHHRLNDSLPVPEELGGTVNFPGDCHSFYKLIPADVYFKDHPEYYSLWNGERLPCRDCTGPGQPCMTNPEGIEIAARTVLAELRAHPETRIYEISQADADVYCTCPACTAINEAEESPAGSMLYFVNAVAERVEREFPDVLLRTFAYCYSRVPPKTVKARKNVVVRYCTYDSCFRHAIDDPNCALNASTTWKEMEGWRKACSLMSIWNYITNWDGFLSPNPNLYSLLDHARYFADCHAIQVLDECNADNPGGGTFPELKEYLAPLVLWNPYMSRDAFEEHILEFMKAYYGPAWEPMKRYLDLEMEVTKDRDFTCKESIDCCFVFRKTYPEIPDYNRIMRRNYVAEPYQPMYPNHALTGLVERMDEAKTLFREAYERAETDAQRDRIARSEMAVRYVDLFCSRHIEWEMSKEERDAYEAEVKRFYTDKDRYKLHYNNHTVARGR